MDALDIFAQIMAALLTGAAYYLVARLDKWKKWGYIFGLCAQPFYAWTLIYNEMYGLLMLTVWCVYARTKGIYNYWIKK